MEEQKICQREGCNNIATKHCPTCKKEGLEPAYFCSQECFKLIWSTHKLVHQKTDSRFDGFKFTGPLRPGIVSPQYKMPDDILKPEYAESGTSLSEEREKSNSIEIKTPEQIEKMRKACSKGREVLDLASSHLRAGITTDEIDKVVYNYCLENKIYPSPLNYYYFPKSLCTSINEVVCHGIPDSTILKNGDIVNLDITVYVDGYHGDLNETFFIGDVSDEDKKLVESSYLGMKAGIELVKPGLKVHDIGNAIDKVVSKYGFSIDKRYCGHGIGQLFHTTPTVPHYKNNNGRGVLRPGMTFTIEPMVNAGSYQDLTWPDEWTVVTADGKRSAQFEHTILVTPTGYEILTEKPGKTVLEWDPNRFQR